ncbi:MULTISPECIES: hypothetical protein [Pseudonocardia]|nr:MULTISPECIES: hypothetical protein [Pseudonocardia]
MTARLSLITSRVIEFAPVLLAWRSCTSATPSGTPAPTRRCRSGS